jgi:hypothetical protein
MVGLRIDRRPGQIAERARQEGPRFVDVRAQPREVCSLRGCRGGGWSTRARRRPETRPEDQCAPRSHAPEATHWSSVERAGREPWTAPWFARPQCGLPLHRPMEASLRGLTVRLQERPLWCECPPRPDEGAGTRGLGEMSDAVRRLPTGEVVRHAGKETRDSRRRGHGRSALGRERRFGRLAHRPRKEPFARSYYEWFCGRGGRRRT